MGPEKWKMGALTVVLLLAATTPTTTTTTETKTELEFKLQQNFTSELTNKSSPEFKQLSDNVTAALNTVYSKEFGAAFNRSVIKGFSQGSVVVVSELIFNNDSSVPETSAVIKSLVQAASNNSNFSLPLNTLSIVARRITIITSVAVNVTATPCPATTPASTNPPTPSEGTLNLKFSLNQIFTSDLANSSSTAFKTLAAEVVTELNKVGTRLYGSSFLRSIVNTFTDGSVVVNSTLVFKNKTSVPSASNATSQLNSELTSNSSSLNIVFGSVNATSSSVATTAAPNVTAASTAAPTSTSSSLLQSTMGSLAVFSLTLLAVAQMLIDL